MVLRLIHIKKMAMASWFIIHVDQDSKLLERIIKMIKLYTTLSKERVLLRRRGKIIPIALRGLKEVVLGRFYMVSCWLHKKQRDSAVPFWLKQLEKEAKS